MPGLPLHSTSVPWADHKLIAAPRQGGLRGESWQDTSTFPCSSTRRGRRGEEVGEELGSPHLPASYSIPSLISALLLQIRPICMVHLFIFVCGRAQT